MIDFYQRKTVVLKNAQYIIDLEDNHSGREPLVITMCWTNSSDRRKELYADHKRRRQRRQLEAIAEENLS